MSSRPSNRPLPFKKAYAKKTPSQRRLDAMKKKGGSKSQKVVVTPGLIKAEETSVIEIPTNLQNVETVYVKPKPETSKASPKTPQRSAPPRSASPSPKSPPTRAPATPQRKTSGPSGPSGPSATSTPLKVVQPEKKPSATPRRPSTPSTPAPTQQPTVTSLVAATPASAAMKKEEFVRRIFALEKREYNQVRQRLDEFQAARRDLILDSLNFSKNDAELSSTLVLSHAQ